MKKAIKKSFLLGLGAVSMTKAKIERGVRQLVKSNGISIREGKAMMRSATNHMEREGRRLSRLAQIEAQRLAREAKLMSNKHLQTMNKSLRSMDARLTAEGKKTLQKIMRQLSR